MIIAVLTVFGLCLGSFINALVYRLRWQESNHKDSDRYSIVNGRSICPKCKHRLSVLDLIPVASWLFLGGKCRYCKKPISIYYPLVEAVTAILFVVSYIFWPTEFTGIGIVEFSLWLVLLTGLIALAVYDIKWMILPNKIIFPLYILVLINVVTQVLYYGNLDPVKTSLWGIVVGGGIFYLLFQISGGKWIGGGDVKLGFLLGAITGGPVPAFLMIFIASLLGSIFSVPMILKKRLASKSKIAFGPFLILATIIVYLADERIMELYNNLLML